MKDAPGQYDSNRSVLKSTALKNTKHLSQVLTQAARDRVAFDPTNRDHRVAYQVFRDSGVWTMNFFCESGFTSVVATIERKIIEQSLKDIAHLAQPITEKVLTERAERKARDADKRASGEKVSGAPTRDAGRDAADERQPGSREVG